MKKKFSEKTFKAIIASLANMADEIEGPEEETLQKAVLEFLDYSKNMKSSDEEVFWMLNYVMDNIKRNFLRTSSNFSSNQIQIIMNYEFIDSILTSLMEMTQGSPCSCDRAGYIIRKVVNYETNKKTTIENGLWNTPKYGTIEDWHRFVTAAVLFAITGKPDEFIKEYANILRLYNENKKD